MQAGTVIRFNKIKGYGFISPNSGGKEVFVHFSAVQTAGYKELVAGQQVNYVLKQGERGDFATEVSIIV